LYIWDQSGWPDLTWDSGQLAYLLGQASREQGRLLGRMQDLDFDLRLTMRRRPPRASQRRWIAS
jgi:hypothetical protein